MADFKALTSLVLLGAFIVDAGVGLTAFAAVPATPAPIDRVGRGQAIYRSKGCSQCHGLAAQGAIGVGPALNPPRLEADAFRTYVRGPAGAMPPYSATLLPDEEVDAVLAYLRSMPAPKRAAEIPLLARYVAGLRPRPAAGVPFVARAPRAILALPATGPAPRTSTAAATNAQAGARLYGQYCAGCHGASLQGGVAPPLRGERARQSLAQISALVRNPPARMPRLFPAPLSESDVNAVAAYVYQASGPGGSPGRR